LSVSEVYIVSAARTAVGRFGGSLASVPAPLLGGTVVEAALERAGLSGEAVGEVYFGCVLTGGLGQAPARQASLAAKVPESVPCTTVGKVCGSGLQSVIVAARALKLGEVDVAVAGGMENMSAAAYAVPKARSGLRLGHGEILDMMVKDGLWDVYSDLHMGALADMLAREENITREDYAVVSYKRALKAAEEGITAWEIAPVKIPQRKGDPLIFEEDEGPKIFNEAKMRKMGPAFNPKDGTVTAGNASSINDGAAAVVLANEAGIEKHNLKPLARIVAWGSVAVEPKRFPKAPIKAIQGALDNAGLKAADIDIWEINEAFAIVPILAMRELDLELEKVNPLGGAVSIGHPIGASGSRILTTLLNGLRVKKGKLGLSALCIGGGEGNAMIVEAL
jgi:acetyl-CoA C-acetyltransferase